MKCRTQNEGTRRENTGFARVRDVALYCGMKEKTLANWRLMGRGPQYRKVGGTVRYAWDDVFAWLESRPTGGEQATEVRP
jgi:predicted DNA-binding transcriptional regulator AlpA